MRSRGAFEFRTPPSDFGRMGSKVRQLVESGHTPSLCRDVLEVMTATNAGYTEEMYKTSCRIFGDISASVWDGYYQLHKDITDLDLTLAKMSDMYRVAKRAKVDMEAYVAVAIRKFEYDGIVDYAKRIYQFSGCVSVQAWTFLLDEDGKVLYVRRFFLQQFRTGRDILNVLMIQERVREMRKRQTKKTNVYDKYYGYERTST